MQERKLYYYISEKKNGEYSVSAYTDKSMLNTFKKSGEERGERMIYESELDKRGALSLLLITNFLNDINKKKGNFNEAELEEILTKENKSGFR